MIAQQKCAVSLSSHARLSDILIFVPTYNEQATIARLLDALLSLPERCDVLVVDDNSTDGTGAVLSARVPSEPRLQVIVRPDKLDIGSAHRLGWTYARIVTLDADLSHDPADVARLLALLTAGADVAFGSRFAPGGRLDYRGWRGFLSRGGNLAARWLLGLPITEYTTSLRGAFFLVCAVRMVRQGLEIKEIPIHFRDRSHGVSKISRGEIIRAMVNLTRLALERAVSADGRKH
jgi:dolichol-phosphate mannosyltransferase